MKSGFRTREGSRSVAAGRVPVVGPAQNDEVRVANRLAVLDALAELGAASRATLAHRTGLSVPTVATILTEFAHHGFVRDAGQEDGTGGRPALRFVLDPDARHVLAVDLSGRRALAERVDLLGRVVERREGVALRPGAEAELFAWLGTLLADPGAAAVAHVAVAVPGIVDLDGGRVDLAPALGWHGFPLRDRLEAHLGCPVLLENDVNALALAEMAYGVGRDAEHVVYVAIGSGIGAGLIVHGRLVRGAHAAAGEIGSSLTPWARGDGAPAVADGAATGGGLERDLMALAERFTDEDGRVDLAEAEARAAFERFAEAVRAVLHNLACALDPELLVVAWPADADGALVDHLQRRWRAPMPVAIVAGSLGPGGAAAGVAHRALAVVRETTCRTLGRTPRPADAFASEEPRTRHA